MKEKILKFLVKHKYLTNTILLAIMEIPVTAIFVLIAWNNYGNATTQSIITIICILLQLAIVIAITNIMVKIENEYDKNVKK